jgi:hypothetical protein
MNDDGGRLNHEFSGAKSSRPRADVVQVAVIMGNKIIFKDGILNRDRGVRTSTQNPPRRKAVRTSSYERDDSRNIHHARWVVLCDGLRG